MFWALQSLERCKPRSQNRGRFLVSSKQIWTGGTQPLVCGSGGNAMATRTPIPLVRRQLDKMRMELLCEKPNAKPLIAKLTELFNVRGVDAVAFSKRLELRKELREILANLDCSEDLSNGQ